MLKGKKLTIVAAVARNGAIGLRGRMPWHLPRELRHFKRTTLGKPVLMGRKTWEAIGRALPGRQNIVVTRSPDYRAEGVECASTFEEAVQLAARDEVMVIGGGALYRVALPWADRMVLTIVNCSPEADTWFPRWDESRWRVLRRQRFPADEDNPFDWEVRELERVSAEGP